MCSVSVHLEAHVASYGREPHGNFGLAFRTWYLGLCLSETEVLVGWGGVWEWLGVRAEPWSVCTLLLMGAPHGEILGPVMCLPVAYTPLLQDTLLSSHDQKKEASASLWKVKFDIWSGGNLYNFLRTWFLSETAVLVRGQSVWGWLGVTAVLQQWGNLGYFRCVY